MQSIWTIPHPDPNTTALFQNTNRDSFLFLQAAGILPESKEHKELKKIIRILYRQHLHPLKYVEEQTSRVERLIDSAYIHLPWLEKYEAGWPARIYLKRYVDHQRPHLRHTSKCGRLRRLSACKSPALASYDEPIENGNAEENENAQVPNAPPASTSFFDLLEYLNAAQRDHVIVHEFLASLTPSLEHHLDAFVKSGVKDRHTLQAFLSWPQVTQSQFLDEAREVLQLTILEKTGLFMGVSQIAQKALKGPLASIVKPGGFSL